MRLTLLFIVLLIYPSFAAAQQLQVWYRIYTFDDSIIEMNTSWLPTGGKDTGRVSFRWTFGTPQSLRGDAKVKYKSRQEVMEFSCTDRRFWLQEVTLVDSNGKAILHEIVNPPAQRDFVVAGSMTDRLFEPACKLIKDKLGPPEVSAGELEVEKVRLFAIAFSKSLEREKDFKPLIKQYFSANYIDGYLLDKDRDWFLNLNKETAANVSRTELERYYIAYMNVGYLSSLYLITKYPTDGGAPVQEEKLMPADVVQLIKSHPYTAAYKKTLGSYDYLRESIDSAKRLRSYTDLLEKIGGLMRTHVTSIEATRSREYQEMVEEWSGSFRLYGPQAEFCEKECLGLPEGTILFKINVPMFKLQIYDIAGQMKIVSAGHFLQ